MSHPYHKYADGLTMLICDRCAECKRCNHCMRDVYTDIARLKADNEHLREKARAVIVNLRSGYDVVADKHFYYCPIEETEALRSEVER